MDKINPDFTLQEIEEIDSQVIYMKFASIIILYIITMFFGYFPYLW
jgi:hypothetical protein